jgi:O-antigen/teichoic acid export membrane protein
MSLKRNVVANYFSQAYVALIGILTLPLYIKYMGNEAYGLVGFFAMLSAWFQLLDVGLSPALSRETARFNAGGGDAATLRRLLRALEGIFAALALAGCGAILLGSAAIATQWLNAQHLLSAQVVGAIQLMAPTIALRFLSGLYRGAITGFEEMVWLGWINVSIATLRFVLIVPFFVWVGSTPIDFFAYQLAVGVLELVLLAGKTYSLIPATGERGIFPWQWGPLRRVLGFSLSIAFSGVVWVVVTQTDKLLISKFLPLGDYGYFTATVLAASAITLVTGPITQAMLPRLTRLAQQSDAAGVVMLYRQATQAVAIVAGSASVVMAVFAEQILWIWTGNAPFAGSFGAVLALYAIGNGFLVLSAFPYHLQCAYGNLQLHVRGNVLFVMVLVPAIVLATVQFGALGAGAVWAAVNALFLFGWTPLVHQRFVPGLHGPWVRDVLKVLAVPLLLSPALWFIRGMQLGRVALAVLVVMAAMTLMVLALQCSMLPRPGLGLILYRLRLGGRRHS